MLPMHAVLTRLTGQHFPSLVPYNENRGRYLHKKCVVCTKHGTRNDVKYICRRCVGQPGLCVDSCFERYHTKLHYQCKNHSIHSVLIALLSELSITCQFCEICQCFKRCLFFKLCLFNINSTSAIGVIIVLLKHLFIDSVIDLSNISSKSLATRSLK